MTRGHLRPQTNHPPREAEVVLAMRQATLAFGSRVLWAGLGLDVRVGEFVAVLGPNGSGKTSLLRTVLGAQPLTSGDLSFLGQPVRRGHRSIGYIPQQKLAERGVPLRAQDLVRLGIDGTRWGLPMPNRSARRRVADALAAVGASHLAKAPLGSMSGGEQQRVRVGQALIGAPRLLLCDEPLSSLDLYHQRVVSELLDQSRRNHPLGVVMITHDINPVLDMVDRVVYLAAGQARVGTVDEVLTTEVLSELYQTSVEVLRLNGRVVVVGVPEDVQGQLSQGGHHHEDGHR